jgi:hypothetical protein
MNKVYYDLVSQENYKKGIEQGVSDTELKYKPLLDFLNEHKDKNNNISKKIKQLLEQYNS